jgi:hypothetical protein
MSLWLQQTAYRDGSDVVACNPAEALVGRDKVANFRWTQNAVVTVEVDVEEGGRHRRRCGSKGTYGVFSLQKPSLMWAAIGGIVDIAMHADVNNVQATCVFGERSTHRRNLCQDIGDLLRAEQCQEKDAFYTCDGVDVRFFVRLVD